MERPPADPMGAAIAFLRSSTPPQPRGTNTTAPTPSSPRRFQPQRDVGMSISVDGGRFLPSSGPNRPFCGSSELLRRQKLRALHPAVPDAPSPTPSPLSSRRRRIHVAAIVPAFLPRRPYAVPCAPTAAPSPTAAAPPKEAAALPTRRKWKLRWRAAPPPNSGGSRFREDRSELTAISPSNFSPSTFSASLFVRLLQYNMRR